ncbi:carbohydrate esterase family 8 [Lecanosticta acicola]|uniref:Pectinesterase n=1 Tax=Lecanosticta acicola TaxID=111012 RepID=A0AAI9EAR1_9PEZI|nr:carbohydrate esterase family 8 [Lecanosticta acicola]
MQLLYAVLALTTSCLAASHTSAPAGALIVGSGGYGTIQAAVNALSSATESAQTIFIKPGTYKELVAIKKLAGPLTIYGYTEDTSSYSANRVIITAANSAASAGGDDASGTLRVETSKGFKMYNINVVNSYGPGSQAIAVSANADNQGYYACSFTGYQDTLRAAKGHQLYAKCYIEGAIDFIFGKTASAWFDSCDIGVLPQSSQGAITASGRSSADSSYYVFNKATIAAAHGQSVAAGTYYLGRPWGDYARVAFQYSSMSSVVNAAGWQVWDSGDERTGHVMLAEYRNTGTGAKGQRARFATTLSRALVIGEILGGGYASAVYVDTSYL